MNEAPPLKKGWGCLMWAVTLIVLGLLGSLFVPSYGLIPVTALQLQASQNAREIVGMLQTWATEHNGQYPDQGMDPAPLSSNDVFVRLIRAGLVPDETVFGGRMSRFMPDRNVGTAPLYDQALIPGENHWAMTAGLSYTESPGHFPLIFDNPVDTSWPPRWLIGSAFKPVAGRVFPGDVIIVGFNLGNVELIKLRQEGNDLRIPPHLLSPAKQSPVPALKVLNIEQEGTGHYVDPSMLPGFRKPPPETKEPEHSAGQERKQIPDAREK